MDITFRDHGSLWIATPESAAGREWMSEHLPEDAQRWGQDSVVIEPRYVSDIIDGALGDGLSIASGRA